MNKLTGLGAGTGGSVGNGVMGGLLPVGGRTTPGVGASVLFVPATPACKARNFLLALLLLPKDSTTSIRNDMGVGKGAGVCYV